MPRILGIEYRWRDSKLWRDSLVYLGINAGVMLAAAAIAAGACFLGFLMGSLTSMVGFMAGLIVAALVILVALFGVPSILLFLRRNQRRLGVSRGRAAAAYIVVVLVANAAYLALAFGYAALMGVI
jgi:positive regulator of sigma E activity